MKRTLLELVGLGILSLVLGFGVNAVRPKGHIKPNYNYFAKTAEPPKDPGKVNAAEPIATVPSPRAGAVAAPKEKPIEHDYQEIVFDELVKVFRDPATRRGLNVFVDARKAELFDEGHIPGAMQCDPYEAGETLDAVIARVNGVEHVVVYCSGGDCEDSVFLCRQLVEAGVPHDDVYLYPGGWNEWASKNMPAEAGSTER